MYGTLYLIPCPISDETAPWDVLPAANRAVMDSLDYFIVENTRSARRFLSRAGIQRPIDSLRFAELNEHSTPEAVAELLTPVLAGTLMRNISYKILFPYAAVFVCLYADGGGEGNELYALCYRALHLLGERGHVGLTAAVYAGYLPCAEADGASAYVHGHVAAAYHDYLLAGKVGQAVVAYGAKHLDGAHYAPAVFALYAGLFVGVGAYGYIQCVIFVLKLVEAHVASDGYAGLYFYAGREYGFNLLIQYLPRKAIGGDAVAQHAAQL